MQNSKKRIIIVSPDSRHFIQEYITNVFSNTNHEILFLSLYADLSDKTWENNNVTVYNLKKTKNESSIVTILAAPLRLISIRKSIGKVDVIHYHYIDYKFTRLVDVFLKKCAINTVMTFWGSDLLKASSKVIMSFKKIFDRATHINVMSKEMLDVFERNTKGIYKDKTIVLDFGNSTLEKISRYNSNCEKTIALDKYLIPKDKIIIHAGYNGSSAQQHIKMAEALTRLDENIKSKIFIVVPFGYGCISDEYKKRVQEAFLNSGINYRIDTQYLSQDEVVEYRKTADVFLYAQETDALSCSVIEYLCSGSLLIKPSWLDYKELTDLGVEMLEYSTFEELKELIEAVITQKKDIQINDSRNAEKIIQVKSWIALKQKWLNLYN